MKGPCAPQLLNESGVFNAVLTTHRRAGQCKRVPSARNSGGSSLQVCWLLVTPKGADLQHSMLYRLSWGAKMLPSPGSLTG